MRTLCALVAIAACSGLALAQVTIQVPGAADNTLYDDPAGQLSNGAGTAMFAGNNAALGRHRALVRFDVASAVPAGMTITGARLRLVNSAANLAPASVSLHRVLESWGEGSSVATGGQGRGAPPEPGDATWLHRHFPGVLWSTPGGSFNPAASAATIIVGPAAYSWESPALLADVQAFFAAPAANFGWLLLGDEAAASSAKRFSTREEPDRARVPILEVTYVPAPPTLLALVALGVASRRRRR